MMSAIIMPSIWDVKRKIDLFEDLSPAIWLSGFLALYLPMGCLDASLPIWLLYPSLPLSLYLPLLSLCLASTGASTGAFSISICRLLCARWGSLRLQYYYLYCIVKNTHYKKIRRKKIRRK